MRWHGLEKISGYTNKAQPFEAPRNVAIACFYISVFLFFEMAWEYSYAVLYPELSGGMYMCIQSNPDTNMGGGHIYS